MGQAQLRRLERKRQRKMDSAMKLQALYQAIGGDWVDSRVEWHEASEDTVEGFWAYGLPILTEHTERMWIGKFLEPARARVLQHRRRALRPERVSVAERVADVVCSVADAVSAVAK
tara:strand:+ start:473 stop:820 length:348 start_codon:yes stop_codon:yes gene_type:complete